MAPAYNRLTIYSTCWRNRYLTDHCTSIEQMAQALSEAAAELRSMAAAGVVLDGDAGDDYATLVTTDPAVAQRFQMQEVDEWEEA